MCLRFAVCDVETWIVVLLVDAVEPTGPGVARSFTAPPPPTSTKAGVGVEGCWGQSGGGGVGPLYPRRVAGGAEG